MKTHKRRSLQFVIMTAIAISACSENSTIPSCVTNEDCPDEAFPICYVGQCIEDKTPADECTFNAQCPPSKPICKENVCIEKAEAEPECSKTKPCAKGFICKDGTCKQDSTTPGPECSDSNPCAKGFICKDGTCKQDSTTPGSECSDSKPCANGFICKDGTCKQDSTTPEPECSDSKPCANGFICKDGTCKQDSTTPEPECSDSNPCANGFICKDGACKQDSTTPEPECSANKPCANGLECSGGKCIPVAPTEYVADLIDVVFNDDGSAKNIAPTALKVETKGTAASVTYNEVLERNVATFNNTLGKSPDSYYRIDFGSDETIKSKIADGHTLEIVLKLGTSNSGNVAVHPFSATESGGTGLLVSDSSSGKSFTYLPHIGGSYVSVNSDVVPKSGTYYHVVGVYDKSKGSASIYVNGELKKSVNVSGDFKFGTETWFGIGADATTGGAEAAWKGDITIARVYDNPLDTAKIHDLYVASKVEDVNTNTSTPSIPPSNDPINVTGVDAMGTLRLSPGYHYYIYGNGFLAGDVIRFESTTNSTAYDCETFVEEGRIVAVIPDDFVTDTYNSILVRGEQTKNLASGKLTVLKWAPRTTRPKIVAHMGYWKNANHPANSRASIKAALKLGVYGIEIDTIRAKDGGVFIGHPDNGTVYRGIDVYRSNSEDVLKKTLTNGEYIPTYEDAIKTVLETDPRVRILIHHKDDGLSAKLKTCMEINEKYEYTENVDHMMDSNYSAAVDAAKKVPEHSLSMCLQSGHSADEFYRDNVWPNLTQSQVTESMVNKVHNHGMSIGAWTINSTSDFNTLKDRGVDYITTDYPDLFLPLTKVFCEPVD